MAKRKRRPNGEGMLRQRADGRWEARYADPREPDPKKRTKTIINRSQKEVLKKLRAALEDISNNTQILSAENPTVEEWVTTWLREYKINELRDSTYEVYEGNIKHYIVPLIGTIKIKDLTGANIQYVFNQMQMAKSAGGFGLSSSTAVKVKNILSGAIKQAIKNKIIRINPLLETNAPREEAVEIRILSIAEQKQFLSVLPFFNTINLFAIALATGMRIGEICALDIADVNREQKYISITKTAGRRKDKYTGEVSIKIGPPKTKYSKRRIPLLPSVEVMLDRQALLVAEMKERAGDMWHENSLVFPTDEGNIHSLSGLRTSLKRILNRAGLPHITIHALRHTYATTALNAGVAAQNVAKLLGHKDGATTLKIYAHYINTEAIAQLEKLEEQNITHLGLTKNELASVVLDTAVALTKTGISEMLDDAVFRAKNFPPKKSVEMVLSVCEDILCQSPQTLSDADRDKWLVVFAQYTSLKRQYENSERQAGKKAISDKPAREPGERER